MLALLVKTVMFVSFAILVRGTLPRYRVDQLLTLNWKYLLFILIFFLYSFTCDQYFLFKLV